MGDLLHPAAADDDETEETPFDPGDFVLAFQADDQMQAQLLVAACEEADIPAILQSPRSGLVGKISSPVEGFNILVPKTELAKAQVLLEERMAALDADPEGAAKAAEDEEAAGEKS
jgi:Putative prokaryotic signal transducing protein